MKLYPTEKFKTISKTTHGNSRTSKKAAEFCLQPTPSLNTKKMQDPLEHLMQGNTATDLLSDAWKIYILRTISTHDTF